MRQFDRPDPSLAAGASPASVSRLRLRRPLLWLHVLCFAVSIGATASAILLLTSSGRQLPAASQVVSQLLAPISFVTLASGLALTWASGRNLARERWLLAKLLLTSGLAVAATLSLAPALAEAAADASWTLSPRPALLVAPVAALALMAAAVGLSIFKPRLGGAR